MSGLLLSATDLLLPPSDDSLVVRDGYGRPTFPETVGRAHTRVSTVAKTIGNTDNLTAWKCRETLKGVALRPDLAVSAFGALEDRSKLGKLVETALTVSGASSGAEYGTALHALTAQVEMGRLTPDDIPNYEMRADVLAYVKTLDRLVLRSIGVEFLVRDPVEMLAGTCDRLYENEAGERFVGDLKTSGSDSKYLFGPTSIQLATYRAAEPCTEAGELLGWPDDVARDRGLLVHIPKGTATVHVYYLDLKRGLYGRDMALSAREWEHSVAHLIVKQES